MPTRPGRPRDRSIDERALAATAELLVEVGFEGTTVQAVAKRSGVHASAIYRRWPSRIELIEEAAFPGFDDTVVEPTGDLRGDLHRFVQTYLDAFGRPIAQAAMPGLLAHTATRHDHELDHYLRISTRPLFHAILEAAPPGAVDPDIDPDDAFDVVLGTVLARTIVPPIATRARTRPLAPTITLLLHMLRPPA